MDTTPPRASAPASPRPRRGPTGPRSADGKERASVNPTRHGLTGLGLVLPGENIADYRAHQARNARALPAGSPGEAVIVFEIGDIEWRRLRLLRLEHAHQLRLVEDALKKTEDYTLNSLACRALTAINVLHAHAENATTLNPFPATEEGLRPLIGGAKGTKGIVEEVEGLDERSVEALDKAVTDLDRAAADGRARPEHLKAIAVAAGKIQGQLTVLVRRGSDVLGRMREQIAANLVPGDDREYRRLARYRAELEKSQSRLLGILGQARDQRKAAQADAKKRDGDVQVRLRVVK
jgi:hypothetical protein